MFWVEVFRRLLRLIGSEHGYGDDDRQVAWVVVDKDDDDDDLVDVDVVVGCLA